MKLSIIVAISSNYAIGNDNKLLWHISDDLQYFKRVTSGHTVVMGRKTWHSLGRALPNRRNLVISNTLKNLEGGELFHSLEEAIKSAKEQGESELFIIGGGELYRATLPIVDRVYLTIVEREIEVADTFFPEIDFSQWREVSSEELSYGKRVLLER